MIDFKRITKVDLETWKPKENLIQAIVDHLHLLGVEHEGGVSHQVLGSRDGVVLVTREDLEHPADDSDNLQGLHLGRGDVLGLLNQQAYILYMNIYTKILH